MNTEYLRRNNKILVVGISWVLLMVLPWGRYFYSNGNLLLAFFVDLIRVGVALVLFLVPGILLYWLLGKIRGRGVDWEGAVPAGFVFSILFVSAIGFMGRLFGFSFAQVKLLFILIGVVEFFLISIIREQHPENQYPAIPLNMYYPLAGVCLLSGLLTFNDHLFFYDDIVYLAYLTNWQFSSQLGFQNLIHSSSMIEIERFWLALYPMHQALIADLSNVSGLLLLGNYIELYYVPLAVTASFWLARKLGLSIRAATISVLVQLAIFSWMIGDEWPIGNWYFQSMAEDKVSAVFHLAPVLFVFVLDYLSAPSRLNLILIGGCGIALALTHPISLLFSCMIAGGMALFAWISRWSGWRQLLELFCTFALVMLPYALIRLINYSSGAGFVVVDGGLKDSFLADKFVCVVNDLFYGLNPGVLKFMDIESTGIFYSLYQWFRMLPVVIMIGAGILSWKRLSTGPLYWYLLSCGLLIGFAAVPYTGWILGVLASARLISRTAWFLPVGMASAVLWGFLVIWNQNRQTHSVTPFVASALRVILGPKSGPLFALILITPVLLAGNYSSIPRYFEELDHNRQLTQIGLILSQHAPTDVTAISINYEDTQLLPGVASSVRLISFREEKLDNGHNFYMTEAEIRKRIRDSNLIRSMDADIPVVERCWVVEKYDLQWVLADRAEKGRVFDYLGECGFRLTLVIETSDLALIEIAR
jgi:hypothetical protein